MNTNKIDTTVVQSDDLGLKVSVRGVSEADAQAIFQAALAVYNAKKGVTTN